MRPRLRALASRQGGLITRRQALAAGYLEGEIRRLTRDGGPWVPVRRGVYADRELWEQRDPYDGDMCLRDRAAHLLMTRPHLMTHDSAARSLRLPMLRPDVPLVHVTRFGVGGSRTEEGVKHHLTRLGLLDNAVVDGMRVTGLARTALDLAREHGLLPGVVACDAAMQRGARPEDFEDALVHMWCWPHVTRARAAAGLADPGAETPGESLTRMLLLELDLGEPETQFPVRTGSGVAWTDLRIGRHVVEFDGRTKYREVENGGVSSRQVEDVLWEERRRQAEVCATGLGMSRVSWEELFGSRRDQTKRRLAAEYALTRERFGERLTPAMAEFADRMRSRGRGRRTA